MKVTLTFAPYRTREYTGTLFDVMPGTDMFVPFYELVAATVGSDAAVDAGGQVVEKLMDGCPFFSEDHVPAHEWLTRETQTLRAALKMAWQEAVQQVDFEIDAGGPPPDQIFVVLKLRGCRPWGQPQNLIRTHEPVGVYMTARKAEEEAVRRMRQQDDHEVLTVSLRQTAPRVAA